MPKNEARWRLCARWGLSRAEIARQLGRLRSTVCRELKRNASPHNGWYRAGRAEERAVARRKRSRRNQQFGREELARVEELLKEQWIPEKCPDTWGGRASWPSATRQSFIPFFPVSFFPRPGVILFAELLAHLIDHHTPHSPTPVRVLTVSGAAGAKGIC